MNHARYFIILLCHGYFAIMPCYDISLLSPHIILPSYVVLQHAIITVDVVLVLLDVINSHAYMHVIPAWCLHLE